MASLLLLIAAASTQAVAQAIPAASADPVSTGFQLPTALGSMRYSVTGTESLTSGYYGNTGWQPATGLTGNLALISPSHLYPTSLVFAGGRFWSTSSQPSTSYANFAISQVLNTKRWNIILSDSIAYLPATPSVGLGGVPGTGDLGVPPIQTGVDPGLGILTQYSTRITNAASLNIGRQITGKTSFQASGAYSILRYLNAPPGVQYDSNTYAGSGGVSYQIDARNTISGNYAYTDYTYLQGLPGFSSHTVSASYARKVSKRLGFDVMGGPQWITATITPAGLTSPAANSPSSTSLNAFLAADVNYSSRFAAYSLAYSRGTNSGYGVTVGTRADSVRFTASKVLDRVWQVSANAAYTQSSTLGVVNSQLVSPKTFVVSGQAARALAHSLSVYGSYTLEKQSGTGSGALFNVFSGSFQVVSFGLTYAPPAIHLGNR